MCIQFSYDKRLLFLKRQIINMKMLHQQIFIQTNLFHLMLRKPTKWLLLNVAGAKFFLLKLQSLSRIPRTEKDRYFIFLKFALVPTKSPYWDTVLSLGYHCDQFCLSVIIATSFDFCESWGNSRIRFLSIEVKFRFTWGEWKVYQTLHKKWNFPLRIFTVNVTKSAGNCFGNFLEQLFRELLRTTAFVFI